MNKINRAVIIILFFHCLYYQCFSQSTGNNGLSGTILSQENNPLNNVIAELQKNHLKTVTDKNGKFFFQHLSVVDDTLIITAEEYAVYKQAVHADKDKIVFVGTIKLDYNVMQLRDIEITSRPVHSYKSDYSFFSNKTGTSLTDIPQSVSVITKELLKDKMDYTLKDAAGSIAGVNQYSGYNEYTIRGFRAENAQNINGLRGYNSTYTSNMLVNIERVEVIKGPVASLYGNCDPGGTINLVTKKPLESKEASLDVYAGSWNHLRAEGDVTAPIDKNKKVLYRLNAGYDKTNSFRNQNFSNSYQLAPSFTFIPNNNLRVNVDFSLSHINTVLDRGQPGILDSGLQSTPINLSLTQPGNYLHETDVALILSASYKINKNLNFNTGYLHYNTQQGVAEHGFNSYITTDSVNLYYNQWKYHTTTNTLTNYFTYKFVTGNITHQLLFGYDFISSKVALNQQYFELPDEFGEGSGIVGTFNLTHPDYIARPVNTYKFSDYDDDATNVDANVYHTHGLYVQEQLGLHKWKLLLSLRQEFYYGSGDDDSAGFKEQVFLPRVGLVYELKPNISIYSTYSKGFDPFEASTQVEIFDAPFKPLISELFEAGIKGSFFKNNMVASLALYHIAVQNVAVNANDISNPNLFKQQGETTSKGIEAEANGNILPGLSIAVNYAYCDARITKTSLPEQKGNLLENAPFNVSNSWIKYIQSKGLLKGLGLTAGHHQESFRKTLDTDLTLPGFCIFNAGFIYEFKQASFAFTAENITNKTYWSAAYNNISKWPGMPRNYMFRLGYKF